MSEHKQSIPFIDPHSLRELVHSGEQVVIVDVRAPEEFAAGHVEGARSCNAAEQLHKMGYGKAAALRGGTCGWLEGKE